MPGAQCTRGRVCKKSTRISNHRYAASTGIPCAMVLASGKIRLSRPTTGKSLVAADARRWRRGMLAQPVRMCCQRGP